MNSLILPFCFSGLLLLVAGLNSSKDFWGRFFLLFSTVFGILFLGNLCSLSFENLTIKESKTIFFVFQILFYVFYKIFWYDTDNSITINVNSDGKTKVYK